VTIGVYTNELIMQAQMTCNVFGSLPMTINTISSLH